MSIEIIVPALGESVTEATISKIYKKAGDTVQSDEVIFEIETEKVNLEINAPTSGTIEKILKQEKDVVAVGELIATMTKGAAETKSSEKPLQEQPTITDDASAETNGSRANDSEAAAVQPFPNKPAQPATNNRATIPPSSHTSSMATPMQQFAPSVSRLLAENNLDPQNITGSGKRGMLTKGDVLEAIRQPVVSTQANGNEKNNEKNHKPVERVKMSRLRQTIAQRLKDSQNTAAILTTFNEIDMKNVMSLRQKYKESFEKQHNVKLGFMSFFVKAVVDALKAIPAINAEIDGDEIIYKNYYDIGVAVGGSQGLVVPVIRGCDSLNFAQIETEIINLSKKAKEAKLSMQDLSGGTFTISNGGIYGSLLSTPIINPPQSGILGLHKIQERPIAIDGKLEIRPMMYVALSYDHRIVDGKEAVTFLVKVKENIENPERMLLNV